jgi:hypothetical protein
LKVWLFHSIEQPWTGARPFNALHYYQEQQRQENARELQMEENNSHLVQPMERNDSHYEQVNGRE